jgi:fructosamine-3-kinase
MTSISGRIEDALNVSPLAVEPLSGGCVGQVYRARLDGGELVVVKVDESSVPHLHVEGYMLRYLAENSELPVPDVLYEAPELLIMSWLPGTSQFGPAAQRHAAELLADLHAIKTPRFGLERDTLIGGIPQRNQQTETWLSFFRDQRLRYMADEAVAAGRLGADERKRVERLCARLDEWIVEPEHPSLLHGDVWTTNVLARGERITGFLDPAIYYGHPEIELAFTTLFGTFGRPFFERYQELRPLMPGFFETRRDLYNLYPLLVHVRLFGGAYVRQVRQTLSRFGC